MAFGADLAKMDTSNSTILILGANPVPMLLRTLIMSFQMSLFVLMNVKKD